MSRLGTIARSATLAFAVCACVAYIVHQQRRVRAGVERAEHADDSPSTGEQPPVLLPSTKNPNVLLHERPFLFPLRAPE